MKVSHTEVVSNRLTPQILVREMNGDGNPYDSHKLPDQVYSCLFNVLLPYYNV
jgi:hypothetical protein